MMKNKETVKDARTWCDTCHIRIAPTEERIERDLRQYHIRCRPKPHRAKDRYLLHV
jgi:hypothetical protein